MKNFYAKMKNVDKFLYTNMELYGII